MSNTAGHVPEQCVQTQRTVPSRSPGIWTNEWTMVCRAYRGATLQHTDVELKLQRKVIFPPRMNNVLNHWNNFCYPARTLADLVFNAHVMSGLRYRGRFWKESMYVIISDQWRSPPMSSLISLCARCLQSCNLFPPVLRNTHSGLRLEPLTHPEGVSHLEPNERLCAHARIRPRLFLISHLVTSLGKGHMMLKMVQCLHTHTQKKTLLSDCC